MVNWTDCVEIGRLDCANNSSTICQAIVDRLASETIVRLGSDPERKVGIICRAMRLPLYIRLHFRCLVQGKSTPLTWCRIWRLYYHYNNEYNQYPDGMGPRLLEVWQAIKA